MDHKPFAVTRAVCGVVVIREEKYLLVQEKNPKVYGKWNLPGGYVDKGETLEQAAIREAREEVGLEVSIIRQLRVTHRELDRPVLHSYLADIIGGEVKTQEDELLGAKWFTYQEIVAMKSELRDEEYVIGAIEAAIGMK